LVWMIRALPFSPLFHRCQSPSFRLFSTQSALKNTNKLHELHPELVASPVVACVSLLCFEADQETNILFIKRANRGRHAGQVGFPGGRKEPSDPSYLYTVLRETEEEIGVSASTHQLSIIGNMKTFISNQHQILVVPFVGVLQHGSPFTIQEEEVDYIMQVPLSELISGFKAQDVYMDENKTPWKGSTFKLKNQEVIWGLTSRILTHFFQQFECREEM